MHADRPDELLRERGEHLRRGLCATLKAETTYFVVVERVTIDSDSISLSKTNSNNEDSGGTAGLVDRKRQQLLVRDNVDSRCQR